MEIRHQGKKYELLFGSDVVNDGVYLELNDITEEPGETILFAFRSDVDGSIRNESYRRKIPERIKKLFEDEIQRSLTRRKQQD